MRDWIKGLITLKCKWTIWKESSKKLVEYRTKKQKLKKKKNYERKAENKSIKSSLHHKGIQRERKAKKIMRIKISSRRYIWAEERSL